MFSFSLMNSPGQFFVLANTAVAESFFATLQTELLDHEFSIFYVIGSTGLQYQVFSLLLRFFPAACSR